MTLLNQVLADSNVKNIVHIDVRAMLVGVCLVRWHVFMRAPIC